MFLEEQGNLNASKTEGNPTHYDTDTVWDVGFRYTYLPEGFIEASTVYSENGLVILPLNPTYIHICILFFNPRLIIKLTLDYGVLNGYSELPWACFSTLGTIAPR